MVREMQDPKLVFVIHNFLTDDECQRLIERSEQAGYVEAPITTRDGFVMMKEVRNNYRVMLDDETLAQELWDRARPSLPPCWEGGEACGFNERFRFYRYTSGQHFSRHFDGAYHRDNGEISQLTFMVYLNEGCKGGDTVFYDETNWGTVRLRVRPERGKALVFAHHQLHAGSEVLGGTKYVLRTDVMYRGYTVYTI